MNWSLSMNSVFEKIVVPLQHGQHEQFVKNLSASQRQDFPDLDHEQFSLFIATLASIMLHNNLEVPNTLLMSVFIALIKRDRFPLETSEQVAQMLHVISHFLLEKSVTYSSLMIDHAIGDYSNYEGPNHRAIQIIAQEVDWYMTKIYGSKDS